MACSYLWTKVFSLSLILGYTAWSRTIFYCKSGVLFYSQQMTMMFDVQDLAVASPATVSRCGMVYLEPSILGLSPFVRCWLKKLPEPIMPHKEKLEVLFHKFMEPSIKFLRRNLKEIVPTNNGNLTFSLLKPLDCFFVPFIPKDVTLNEHLSDLVSTTLL